MTNVVPVYLIRPGKEDQTALLTATRRFLIRGSKLPAGLPMRRWMAMELSAKCRWRCAAKTGRFCHPFALALLARHAGYDGASLSEQLRAADTVRLNLPEWHKLNGKLLSNATPFEFHLDESWKINFAGGQGSFASLPSEPLAQLARANIPLAADNPFRGKIVLIGASFSGQP